MVLERELNVALIQTNPTFDFEFNLNRVEELFKEVKEKKPETELIVLPEHFSTPINKDQYFKHAETIPGVRYSLLSRLAKEHSVNVVGGSFTESFEGKLYNTSLSFDKQGVLIGRHRKVHLFDIDIPNKITAKESETFSGGDSVTLINIPEFGVVGEGICYDIRFPELATIASRKDSFCMVYPSAFNTTTGPLHWSLLAQSRALDNQMYVIMCSPARNDELKYPVYGHSMIVNPSGKVIAEAGDQEEIIYGKLDPTFIKDFRELIPIRTQTRFDVYKDIAEGAVTSTVEVADTDSDN